MLLFKEKETFFVCVCDWCFCVMGVLFGTRYVIVKFTQLSIKPVCNLLGIPSTEDTMNVVILQTGCQSKPGAHLFPTDSIGIANEWSSSLNSTNSITNNSGQSGNVSVNLEKLLLIITVPIYNCLFYFLNVCFYFFVLHQKRKNHSYRKCQAVLFNWFWKPKWNVCPGHQI